MQCQNLYKSSSKQTIPTICILIHMISFNFVLIIKKSDALHEHILHKIGVLFGLNSKRFKANSYIIYSDDSTKTVSVKWGNANSHMTSFLLIDNNRNTSAYITGKKSGVAEISKGTGYAAPPVLDDSSSTLKVTLGPWNAVFLICFDPVTIS